jgi:hypothetical protein
MSIRSKLDAAASVLAVVGIAGALMQAPSAGDRGLGREDGAAPRHDALCRIDDWTALEPLGDHEDAALFAATARCSAAGPFLHGATTTVELLWDADARRVTWHGADWNIDAGIVVMPAAEARLVPIPVVDGTYRWEARFDGFFQPGSIPPIAGRPFTMTVRLEATTRPEELRPAS